MQFDGATGPDLLRRFCLVVFQACRGGREMIQNSSVSGVFQSHEAIFKGSPVN